MPSPEKPHRPDAWLTKRAMADVLDVTVGYFDKEVRRFAAEDHVKQDGRQLLFYARGLLDAWYSAKLRPPSSVDDNDVELSLLL